MPITIIITKELEEGFWGSEEDLAAMSDEELILLLQEDILAIIDNATWEVRREGVRDGYG